MNTLIFVLVFCTHLFSLNSDTTALQSKIKEVTVFRQQAQIHRQVEIQLDAGTNLVIFEKLSPYLIDNSIQMKANDAFSILSITNRINYFTQPANRSAIQKLEHRKDSLQKEITLLIAELDVINRALQLLQNTSGMIQKNELTAAELAQLLDLYRERASKLEREKISMNESRDNIQQEINKLNAQIRELGGNQTDRFSEVIAEIQSDKTQTLTFDLEYLVRNSGWTPTYDIRSENTASPLSINYKVNIYQHTGVDWTDVQFTINSGNPSVNATVPEIYPNYVGFDKPTDLNAELALDEVVVTGMSKSMDMAPAAEQRETNVIANTETQNQTTFSYEIEIPYSVPSDGKSHTVEIKRETPETVYTYTSIPKLSPYAYLIGKITGWDDLNLIAGEANIYFENSFVGTTRLNPGSFDDTLSVSLGRDESISIERTKRREFEERNFFGNKTGENHSWEISIRNTKSEPVEITVKDQLPLSRDVSIKIDPKQLSGGHLDKKTGIVTWSLNLNANESKKLRFDFEIEYPTGKPITY